MKRDRGPPFHTLGGAQEHSLKIEKFFAFLLRRRFHSISRHTTTVWFVERTFLCTTPITITSLTSCRVPTKSFFIKRNNITWNLPKLSRISWILCSEGHSLWRFLKRHIILCMDFWFLNVL